MLSLPLQDSAEIFVRMSAENIAAEELRQLRLGRLGQGGPGGSRQASARLLCFCAVLCLCATSVGCRLTRIMKSARQTEQKVATVEKTLQERRTYLKNLKERVANSKVYDNSSSSACVVRGLRFMLTYLADSFRKSPKEKTVVCVLSYASASFQPLLSRKPWSRQRNRTSWKLASHGCYGHGLPQFQKLRTTGLCAMSAFSSAHTGGRDDRRHTQLRL